MHTSRALPDSNPYNYVVPYYIDLSNTHTQSGSESPVDFVSCLQKPENQHDCLCARVLKLKKMKGGCGGCF